MIETALRRHFLKSLTTQHEIVLENRTPSQDELQCRFVDIDELGVYLHIPFCRQICPYCPYNKERYHPDTARRYTRAVKKEIDFYAGIIGRRPVTSCYIGGGTPTSMLHSGLQDIIKHLSAVFNLQCDIHMESHLNDLSPENLDVIANMGVRHLSMGVESLQDRHLKTLQRPYTVAQARETVARVVRHGFKCVNVDVIFAVPGQTLAEVRQTGHALVDMGVDQVAAYPLFRFPYTPMGKTTAANHAKLTEVIKRRKMLRILEKIFYRAGFERTSVWAFTRAGVPRYCSVTVPLYVGLGASGGSYLRDVFYLNTFNVSEYIKAWADDQTAMALSHHLSEQMQMTGWLYWRIYETRFKKQDFQRRFQRDFDEVFGARMKSLKRLGFLQENDGQVDFTDRGIFWLHALEDLFSIDFVGRVWGNLMRESWPEKIVLQD